MHSTMRSNKVSVDYRKHLKKSADVFSRKKRIYPSYLLFVQESTETTIYENFQIRSFQVRIIELITKLFIDENCIRQSSVNFPVLAILFYSMKKYIINSLHTKIIPNCRTFFSRIFNNKLFLFRRTLVNERRLFFSSHSLSIYYRDRKYFSRKPSGYRTFSFPPKFQRFFICAHFH